MEEKNITLKIDNKDNPYEYKGKAILNRDILKFKENNYEYVFDKTTERLTKTSKDTTIVIDFKNKLITIKDKENIKIKIDIIKKQICDKLIFISYKIDSNNIKITINIEEVK